MKVTVFEGTTPVLTFDQDEHTLTYHGDANDVEKIDQLMHRFFNIIRSGDGAPKTHGRSNEDLALALESCQRYCQRRVVVAGTEEASVASQYLEPLMLAARVIRSSDVMSRREMIETIEGLISEWDKLTRYGSPMAKLSNERVAKARDLLKRLQDGRT